MTELGLGFKELYEVVLKATYPIEVGGKTLEENETVAVFDKIQLANFQEIRASAKATGAYDGRSLIIWDEAKELHLNFTQGVFSKTQLALMTNTELIKNKTNSIVLHKRELLESNEKGELELSQIPRIESKIFAYLLPSGEKTNVRLQQNRIFSIGQPYQEVLVDYEYNYSGKGLTLQVGETLTQGYLSLTGKMKVKDDITGQVTTGIINIPKLRLMSDLSMRLGADAIPQVGRLDAIALPVGGKGNKKIMEIIFLEDDVDSDM